MPLASALLLGALMGASPRAPSYAECVRLYGRGAFDRAVQCAVEIPTEEANRQAAQIVEATPPPARRRRFRQLQALATEQMLEGSYLLSCASPASGEGWPSNMPRLLKPVLIERMEATTPFGPPDYEFLADWYLLAVAYNRGHGFLPAAEQCIRSAPAEIRRLPEMQVAEGTFSEMTCARPTSGSGGASDPLGACRAAEGLYRAALAQAPALSEASLRLSKVLIEQGREHEAADLLQPLLTTPDRDIAYLARLFSALAYQRLGDVDRARTFYQLAGQGIVPTTSSAVGQAALAFGAGSRADAQSWVTRPVTIEGDPWLAYTKGTARHALRHRNRLREMAIEK